VATKKDKAAPAAPRQLDLLTLTDLEQVKVLADPLRLRILEQLCDEERTTKQVAQILGEKPTKLYHHVDALERVGLIRLTRTRPNRGTVEKYYLSVARQFRADSRLFAGSDEWQEDGGTLQAMITTVFERTADEMHKLIAQSEGREGYEEHGVLSHLELRVDKKQARKFQARLLKLIKDFEDDPGAKTAEEEERFRLTLAFYPLPPRDKKS